MVFVACTSKSSILLLRLVAAASFVELLPSSTAATGSHHHHRRRGRRRKVDVDFDIFRCCGIVISHVASHQRILCLPLFAAGLLVYPDRTSIRPQTLKMVAAVAPENLKEWHTPSTRPDVIHELIHGVGEY